MQPKYQHPRVNFQIWATMVRVTQDGQQLGVMPIDKARRLAQDQGLDLMEVAAQAQPPVCTILDFGKYKYEQKMKMREQMRKQRATTVQLKELRLRPGTGDHDIEVKCAQAKKFIEEGKQVQLNLKYKKREIAHKDQGFSVMNKFIARMQDCAVVERPPKIEGSTLTCRLLPKPDKEKNGSVS
jgi:translation initiation factor IF-3